MGNDVVVSARIGQALEREVTKTASEDDRSRSGQIEHLLRIGLAGRERLKELERLAVASLAQHPESAAATVAGAAHLALHAQLAGTQPQEDQS